ncbi:hypothetical protein CEE36_01190 [candidate division TA06 bacterium B3_TA06]|uniref:Uncharacterized protein n=1 Tax=candidate division TA06 bacterium B3_TA06 TaxID=2012487 RepID=A0A532VB06_UNCT6|nr:MAG: hypothetical protein CEE36_01190 [candidate division TA06 bacterium B3_TA06]
MAKVKRVQPYEEPHPFNVSYIKNPTQADLRWLALEHTPACYVTKYGSINKLARNKARKAAYTYIIAPEPDAHLYSSKVIAPERAEPILIRVWEYVELQGKLIEIQGYYGLG